MSPSGTKDVVMYALRWGYYTLRVGGHLGAEKRVGKWGGSHYIDPVTNSHALSSQGIDHYIDSFHCYQQTLVIVAIIIILKTATRQTSLQNLP